MEYHPTPPRKLRNSRCSGGTENGFRKMRFARSDHCTPASIGQFRFPKWISCGRNVDEWHGVRLFVIIFPRPAKRFPFFGSSGSSVGLQDLGLPFGTLMLRMRRFFDRIDVATMPAPMT